MDQVTSGDTSSTKYVRRLPVKLVNHEVAQKFFASAYNIPWIKTPVCYIEGDYINVVYDSLSLPKIETFSNNQAKDKLDVVYIRKPNSFVKDIENYYIPEGAVVTYFDYKGINDSQKIYDRPRVSVTYSGGQSSFDEEAKYNMEQVNAILAEDNPSVDPDEYAFDDPDDFPHSTGASASRTIGGVSYVFTFSDFGSDMIDNTTYTQRYTFECNDTVAEELISLAIIFALENVESQRLNSKLNTRGLEA